MLGSSMVLGRVVNFTKGGMQRKRWHASRYAMEAVKGAQQLLSGLLGKR